MRLRERRRASRLPCGLSGMRRADTGTAVPAARFGGGQCRQF